PFYELLIAANRRTAVLTEHPGWTFGISLQEEEPVVFAGIRGQYGEWTREEEEIALERPPLWTGRELMILGWPNGAALDPLTGRWRTIRGNPRRLRTQTCVIQLDESTILMATKIAPKAIAFDLY